MDRLKKALNRAKAERTEREDVLRSDIGARATVEEESQIKYRPTRLVKVAAKTFEKSRIIAEFDNHPAGNAYKILRTRLLQRMKENGWNSVAITSVGSGEGKSLTAANLAVCIAQSGAETVLLADFDLQRASIHSLFGCKTIPGLTDYLLSDLPLNEILFSIGIDGLVVLPVGDPPVHASELLRSSKLLALVQELKSRYSNRFILFDLPPLLAGDDALCFIPHVDCVLLVVEDGKTRPNDLARTAELLGKTPLIGSVLNKSTETSSTYYSR